MHVVKRQCVLSTVGTILLAIAIIFAIFWFDIFISVLAKELALRPKSKSYEVWKKSPIPLNFDVYLFNWTNPCNFTIAEYQKPILQQLGPYRFKETSEKFNIRWNPRNSTVTYQKRSRYYFDPDGSNGTLDDEITALNVIALSAASKALYWPFLKQKQVSLGLAMYREKTHIVKTARELLFEGYQSDLIDMAKELSSFEGEAIDIPYDRFGWFYQRNGSGDLAGELNIHTGLSDISQFGVVKRWNKKPRIDHYPDECGDLGGSGGEFYPPQQSKEEPVIIFNPEICRGIRLDFTNEVEVRGIKGYKYSGGDRTFDNGTKYSEQKCFNLGDVVPAGVTNISSCRFGTPAFMSFPHFYAADSYFVDNVSGVHPSKEKHEFYIVLEPTTGIPLEVAARVQLNMLVRPVPNVGLFREAPTLFLPMLWFEQKLTIPQEMANELSIAATMPSIGYIFAIALIFIGFSCILWVPIDRCLRKEKYENNLKKDGNTAGNSGKHIEKLPEGSPLIGIKANIEISKKKPIETTVSAVTPVNGNCIDRKS